jgi:hypothetical protein
MCALFRRYPCQTPDRLIIRKVIPDKPDADPVSLVGIPLGGGALPGHEEWVGLRIKHRQTVMIMPHSELLICDRKREHKARSDNTVNVSAAVNR